jgi:orotidine-5'-phosphate decarboxylase
MDRKQLVSAIFKTQSYLCVGLDSDITRVPKHLLSCKDPVFEFNKNLIDATKGNCVAYKINTAFYEARGASGWETMEKTVNYIPSTHFKIADAKRGDIGNTSSQYAKAFFETLNFDAITVAPYMGEDSIRPFLEYESKWTIVLGLTSNIGAKDFELLMTGDQYLYERVIMTISNWGSPENMMFVIGATQANQFERLRNLAPRHFFLVPGVGAQGGNLKEISENAIIPGECGILVNVSRDIIYASAQEDFAEIADRKASGYQQEMKYFLS